MRHSRAASCTIRLGAAGAVLAVLAVLTPAAAFATSGATPPEVSEPSAQTVSTTPGSEAETPEAPADAATAAVEEPGSTPSDEPEATPAPSVEPSEEPSAEPTTEPSEEPSEGLASTAGVAQPSTAEATAEPADSEPRVELEQYERIGGEWQPSDGSVDFGNEIRYVLRVIVPAGQTLPAAQLRAFVPGWDKTGDKVTNVPARLVAGSAQCSIECEIDAGENTGLVVWRLGDVAAGDEDVHVSVEFAARFGQLPLDAQFDSSGMFVARAWCRGELSWGQASARVAAAQTTPGPVYSNAVTATAVALEAIIGTPVTYPAAPGISAAAGPTNGHHAASTATVLPNTGGPQVALAVAGAALVALGGVTVFRTRRSRC